MNEPDLTWRDPSVRLSVVLVGLTLLALIVPVAPFRLLVTLLCALVILRVLWGIWTLNLVKAGQMLNQVRARTPMYVTGVISFTCSAALLLAMRR